MGQLRSALRGIAMGAATPEEVVVRLNQLVEDLGDIPLATVLYGVLDPSTGQLLLISAGHPPALLADREGIPRYLDHPPGPPLGAPGPIGCAQELVLQAGEVLVFYTDGLIERRDQPIDEGLAALQAALATAPQVDLDKSCEHILTVMAAATSSDDIAILAVRRTG
jgi:serine phosphatase RsbU (regulator of sigma subunit)